jgi:phosphohistidine phosphatase SixA
MKHLFILRHGEYDSERNLSHEGQQQIERLVTDMKSIAGKTYKGHYLISSPAPQAEQSAQIIAQKFDLRSFERNHLLWTSGGNAFPAVYFQVITSLIAKGLEESDLVTIVSHAEFVNAYPRLLIKELSGRDENLEYIQKGEGYHLNLEAKKFQHLPLKEI